MKAMDTMIHIDQSREAGQQLTLETAFRDVHGVVAPQFNKAHLLVVEYDAAATTAMALLGVVTCRGYRAQLVGF